MVLLLPPVTPLYRRPPRPQPGSQVSYIRTIRHTPIFLPNFGGESASYSPKNIVPSVIKQGSGQEEPLQVGISGRKDLTQDFKYFTNKQKENKARLEEA